MFNRALQRLVASGSHTKNILPHTFKHKKEGFFFFWPLQNTRRGHLHSVDLLRHYKMAPVIQAITKKRGRPRKDPSEPAKILKPKGTKEQRTTKNVWAKPDEAVLIEAARVVKHRTACRERYQRNRQAIRDALPDLLRKKASKQQSNTLDDYSRHTFPIMGGDGRSQCLGIHESPESQGSQST